ncbi:MAG: hypothetical protein JSR24_09390 [Proteobacteria bacterium]|nr:hypothetical protein [Pseudomonadota bacterium]
MRRADRPGKGASIGTSQVAKATPNGCALPVSNISSLMFDSLSSAAPHIKAGKVRALVVSGEQRNPSFSDMPTMKESGYPDLISYSWFGLSAPHICRHRSSNRVRQDGAREKPPSP